jgi:hypothetical protein
MRALISKSSPIKQRRRTKAGTDALRGAIRDVLAAHNPMTLRQVYYQLVGAQLIDNNRSQYQAISTLLVELRKCGAVPWEWVEDRLRRPREVSMWGDLAAFAHTVRNAYRRDVWAGVPLYVECWLEKDALSGIFEGLLKRYGVTLNVGRGFDGWDSIHNAAERYAEHEDVVVLYWGDFDPSGEDMVRSLRERLAFFGCEPEIIKCALTKDDVQRYNLPTDFTKSTDTRRAAFVQKYGDVSVELDALPMNVLRARIVEEVESYVNMDTLAGVMELQAKETGRLHEALEELR